MKTIVLAFALVLSAPAAFAADSTSARRYGSSEALSVQDARLGEVLMVRTVQLKSDQRLNAGSAIGAAVGYGATNQVKNRDYRNAARVAGGVIGPVAGTAVQKGFSGRRALEIYVRDLSDRRQRVLAVVQDADVDVREGDRVFLVGKGKKTRVVPLDASPARIGKSCNESGCGIGTNASSDNEPETQTISVTVWDSCPVLESDAARTGVQSFEPTQKPGNGSRASCSASPFAPTVAPDALESVDLRVVDREENHYRLRVSYERVLSHDTRDSYMPYSGKVGALRIAGRILPIQASDPFFPRAEGTAIQEKDTLVLAVGKDGMPTIIGLRPGSCNELACVALESDR